MREWPRDWAPKPNISFSSLKVYEECPRKWLYQYPPAELKFDIAFPIRVEARLMPWDALTGQVVDDTIKHALNEFQQGRGWPEDLYASARARLSEYVEVSRRARELAELRKTLEFGGAQAVDRLYFQDPDLKPLADDVKSKVKLCLDHFEQSTVRDFIAGFPVETWRLPMPISVEPVPWFRSGGVPVYASYDFAIQSEQATIIVDWKCGKKTDWSVQRVAEQLHSYAAFAMEAWGAKAERLQLFVFWLQEGTEWDEVAVAPSMLDSLRRKWAERHTFLVAKARMCQDSLAAWEREFPVTDNVRRCARCTIRHCSGFGRAQASAELPAPDQEEFYE